MPGEDVACEEGTVSRIIIESRPIFDPGPPSQPRILRWTRGLANFMHVDTREGFIAGELLFGEGDCPDLFLFEESERILRELGFIATADIVAEPQPDGTRHVRVTTRDEWTTKIQIDVTVDDGLQFEGASVVEENFLGSGNLIGAFYQERKQRRDYGLTLHSTRLAGTRLDGRLNAGRTRSGGFTDAMLVYPFVGEVGRFAGRVRFHRRESLFPYVLDPSLDYSYALLPVFGERIEATQAYRFGEPGDLTLLGFGVTHETLRFDEYPDSVSLVRGLDFGNLLDDEAGIGSRLAHQTRAHELTRFNLLLARRKVRFETRTGLDAVSGEQSVPQGFDLSLTLGPRLPLGRLLSTDEASASGAPAELASDFMGRVSFFGGVGSASAVLLVNAETEARRVRFEDESEGAGGTSSPRPTCLRTGSPAWASPGRWSRGFPQPAAGIPSPRSSSRSGAGKWCGDTRKRTFPRAGGWWLRSRTASIWVGPPPRPWTWGSPSSRMPEGPGPAMCRSAWTPAGSPRSAPGCAWDSRREASGRRASIWPGRLARTRGAGPCSARPPATSSAWCEDSPTSRWSAVGARA